MSEIIILDPTEVASDRTELDISDFVKSDGIDWGDAVIEAYLADQQRGEVTADYRIPNREITIPLVLKTTDDTTFSEIRGAIQSKAALFQAEGGFLKRVLTDGSALFLEINESGLKLAGDWYQAHEDTDLTAVLTLQALPDFFEAEEEITDGSEDGDDGEIRIVLPGARGNYPARTRIVVEEGSGNNQRGLFGAIRSRHYSDDDTAQAAYNATDLTNLGLSTDTTLGANPAVRYDSLPTEFAPVSCTDLEAGGDLLTHEGTYRVLALLHSPATARPWVRFVWDVGDMVSPNENDPVQLPHVPLLSFVDLGQMRLDRVPIGPHRWRGQLQAKGVNGGEDFWFLRLWFLNLDEWSAMIRTRLIDSTAPYDIDGHDEFDQAAGNLAGGTKNITAASNATPIVITSTAHGLVQGDRVWIEGVLGNTAANGWWTVGAGVTANTFVLSGAHGNGAYTSGGVIYKAGKTLPGATNDWHQTGDADVATVGATNHVATRSNNGDVNENTGAYLLRGSAVIDDCAVQVDVRKVLSTNAGIVRCGVLARYVNVNNWLMAVFCSPSVSAGLGLDTVMLLLKRVGGTVTIIDSILGTGGAAARESVAMRSIKLVTDTDGNAFVYEAAQGARFTEPLMLAIEDSHLATGGALASGRVGMYDVCTIASGTNTRTLDNFRVSSARAGEITDDAVMYADGLAQLTTEGIFRDDPTGEAYGPITDVEGGLPRWPVAGLEEREVELLLRPSRGDIAVLPDSGAGLDTPSVRVYCRPSWLFAPTPAP